MSEDPKFEFEVRKVGYTVPVSCCVMTDHTGVNYCKHPPYPPVSRWRRAKYALRSWWWQHRPRLHFGPCDDGEDDW